MKTTLFPLLLTIMIIFIASCGDNMLPDEQQPVKSYTINQMFDGYNKFLRSNDSIPQTVYSYAINDSVWKVDDYIGERPDTLYPDAEFLGGMIKRVPLPKDFIGYLMYMQQFYQVKVDTSKKQPN